LLSVTEDFQDTEIRRRRRTPLDLQHRLTSVIKDMSAPEKRSILQLIEKSLKDEKRRRHRKHQLIKTRVASGDIAENGIIRNLSPCGAFLTTPHRHPPGSEITLSFSILNFEFPVKLKAEIIWISPDGMGLKFKASQKLDYRLAAQKLADAMDPESLET
jgi:hypothetical protein